MVVVIDNYDSFTYNLVQRLGEIDSSLDIRVFRNDELSVQQIDARIHDFRRVGGFIPAAAIGCVRYRFADGRGNREVDHFFRFFRNRFENRHSNVSPVNSC